MTKFVRVIIVAFWAVISVVSCSLFGKDTGADDGENPPVDTEQQVEYEPVEYSCEVATEAGTLSATQSVVGNMTRYDESGQPYSETFKVDLNLGATFATAMEAVSISEASVTTEVALVSTDLKEEAVDVPTEYAGLVKQQVKRDFEFVFNDGAVVRAAALHEKVSHKDNEFAHTAIETIEYKDYEIYLNAEQTTDKAMTYDITLLFEVVLKDNNQPARANQSHILSVHYKRILELLEVSKVAECNDFVAQFGVEDSWLYTIEQKVSGEVVSYIADNTVISREPFSKDLNLEVKFVAPKIVYVERESQLAAVEWSGSSQNADTEQTRSEDGFTISKRAWGYLFGFEAGETVAVNIELEHMNYGVDLLPYTDVETINYKGFDSVLNTTQTTSNTIVHDVTLYFEVKLKAKNLEMSDVVTYIVPVSYKRVYERVETYMVAENWGCEGQFGVEEKHLYSIDYKVNGELVTYTSSNKEKQRVPFSKDINLEVKFAVPEVVNVETEAELTEVALKGSSKSGDTVNSSEIDGFTKSTYTQPNTFKFDASEVVTATLIYEKLKYGMDELPYYKIESVRYKRFESKLNQAQSTAAKIVHDITLYFEVSLKMRNVTSASAQTYTVPVTYKRVFENPTATR